MEKLVEQGTREVISLIFRLVERTKMKILFFTARINATLVVTRLFIPQLARPMSSESNVPEAAAAEYPLMWGESPELYLSYGTVSLAGRRPELTDAVAAVRSFTLLSPPMGLDYFAVVDGRHLGKAVAERLPSRLGKAIAEQVEGELLSENPRFLGASHDGVVAWWRTAVEEAFRAVREELASGGAQPVGATALVALVMEKYFVIASSGGAKAVLCRGGEHIQLTPDPKSKVKLASFLLLPSILRVSRV